MESRRSRQPAIPFPPDIPVSSDHSPASSDEAVAWVAVVAGAARRLQETGKQLATLVQQQRGRWQILRHQWEELLAERNAWRQKCRQLQVEQQQWQQQRKQAQEEIRAEQDRLIEAWNKLEAEQRRLLTEGTATVRPAAPPTQRLPETVPAENVVKREPEATPPLWAAETVMMPALPNRSASPSEHCPEAAREQFERLKYEIRNHARRLRQTSDESHSP